MEWQSFTNNYFQVLFLIKNILINFQTVKANYRHLQHLQQSFSSFRFDQEQLFSQLLLNSTLYQQIKYQLHQELTQLELYRENQLLLPEPPTLNLMPNCQNLMEYSSILKKIHTIHNQSLEVYQQLTLLELNHQISQETVSFLNRLSLRKMIILLFKNQKQLTNKIYFKPFLRKLLILEEMVHVVLKDSYGVVVEAVRKWESNDGSFQFVKKSPSELQKQRCGVQKSSLLTSSIETFREHEQDMEENILPSKKIKFEIKSNFSFDTQNTRKKRKQKVDLDDRSCCWGCRRKV